MIKADHKLVAPMRHSERGRVNGPHMYERDLRLCTVIRQPSANRAARELILGKVPMVFSVSQETTSHQETTTNHNVTAAAIMDMGHFTIHPPTGNGWQIAGVDPAQHPDTKAAFQNGFMKAEVTVRDRELSRPARDVQAALLRTKEEIKQKFESEGKIVLFEGNLEAHSGEECLYTRIIFVASDKFRSDTQWADAANNVALHSLVCIYGEKHDRSANLLFMYPTEASKDSQGQHAKDFFASLEFKGSTPK